MPDREGPSFIYYARIRADSKLSFFAGGDSIRQG